MCSSDLLIAATAKPSLSWASAETKPPPMTRQVRHDGIDHDTLVVDRSSFKHGRRMTGPLVISQYDTTTFVPPGAWVEVDAVGNLIGGF